MAAAGIITLLVCTCEVLWGLLVSKRVCGKGSEPLLFGPDLQK